MNGKIKNKIKLRTNIYDCINIIVLYDNFVIYGKTYLSNIALAVKKKNI